MQFFWKPKADSIEIRSKLFIHHPQMVSLLFPILMYCRKQPCHSSIVNTDYFHILKSRLLGSGIPTLYHSKDMRYPSVARHLPPWSLPLPLQLGEGGQNWRGDRQESVLPQKVNDATSRLMPEMTSWHCTMQIVQIPPTLISPGLPAQSQHSIFHAWLSGLNDSCGTHGEGGSIPPSPTATSFSQPAIVLEVYYRFLHQAKQHFPGPFQVRLSPCVPCSQFQSGTPRIETEG